MIFYSKDAEFDFLAEDKDDNLMWKWSWTHEERDVLGRVFTVEAIDHGELGVIHFHPDRIVMCIL